MTEDREEDKKGQDEYIDLGMKQEEFVALYDKRPNAMAQLTNFVMQFPL